MEDFFCDKSIAVTGAAGTIGQGLVQALLQLDIQEVRALDNNESALFFQNETYRDEPRFAARLCDIRNQRQLRRFFDGVDLVFHAAAFKHVPLCEQSPDDAVQTNIIGVQNVIEAAIDAGVHRVLFTSSDKAVNPTNVMGTSKLMGERLITAANRYGKGTLFCSTRFGNVAGSQGSVIPLFARQIAEGGPVTLTDPVMTRFMMSLDDAVSCLLEAMVMARGGEVFVTRMPVVAIEDLARALIDRIAPQTGRHPSDIAIAETGARVGEKLFEELISSEESTRAVHIDDRFFAVLPAFPVIQGGQPYRYHGRVPEPLGQVYVSDKSQAIDLNALKAFLDQPGVLALSLGATG